MSGRAPDRSKDRGREHDDARKNGESQGKTAYTVRSTLNLDRPMKRRAA